MPHNPAVHQTSFFSFWKKLTLNQKLSLIFVLSFVAATPLAVIASLKQTRTAPRAGSNVIPASPFQPLVTGLPANYPFKLGLTIPTSAVKRVAFRPQGRVPVTPASVSAVCSPDNSVLTSNITTGCATPKFAWVSVADGFYVYFGPKPANQIDMVKDGIFQTAKSYTPTGINPHQTYHLFIQETLADGRVLWHGGGDIDKQNPYKDNFLLKVQ